MKISDEILHKLHELDCEDVAKRFGIDVKRHKAHCFNHDDRIASLGFRGNHCMGRVFRCTKEYSRSSTVRCDNATS